MDWIKLGRNVKYARARKGYTQAEVAELTGYSVQHLSHIENGTSGHKRTVCGARHSSASRAFCTTALF